MSADHPTSTTLDAPSIRQNAAVLLERLDSPAHVGVDRLVRLAAERLGAGAAVAYLRAGGDERPAGPPEDDEPAFTLRRSRLIPTLVSDVCRLARPLIVFDSHTDLQPGDGASEALRAFAGVPLVAPGGRVLGALAILDARPRLWSSDEVETVHLYARAIVSQFELRRLASEALRREALLIRATGAGSDHSSTALLSALSHQLRTPLNAILGFAQLLALDEPDPRRAANLDHILTAGDRLLRLIDDVLDVSRSQLGLLELQLGPVEVAGLVTDTLALATASPGAEHGQFAVDVPADLPPLLADGARLRQVLTGLLTNAATHGGGRALVTAREVDGGRVRVEVVDHGPGIPVAFRHLLLEPFRHHDPSQRAHPQTGLTLAVAHALLTAMDGAVGFDDTPGGGTTAWIELPQAAAA